MIKLKLNEAVYGGGRSDANKFPPGRFRGQIQKVLLKESEGKDTSGKVYFIVEFVVTEVYRQDAHGRFPAVEPGQRRSWACDTSKKKSPGNIKMFEVAAHGIDPNNVKALRECTTNWDEYLELILSEANPLFETEVDIETKEIPLENSIHKFMIHEFYVPAKPSAAA